MKLKNIVRILLLTPLAMYLLYCCFHFILFENRPQYLDCGTVVSRSNDEVAIKHGTQTNLYLNVQFENSGFRSIECSPTTYFSKKVGDKVCFKLDKPVSEWYHINHMIDMYKDYIDLHFICAELLLTP